MDPVVARYPFIEAARAAVAAEAPSLETLLGAGDRSAVLDRALERIDLSITGRSTGTPHRDFEVEVLSYPLARIIVSLVDDPRVTDRYVRAEANTAINRLESDIEAESPVSDGMDLSMALEEFDVPIEDHDGVVQVEVTPYLRLATDIEDDAWRLVNRPLRAGLVTLDEDEVMDLLEAAIRRRVGDSLPLTVPDDIAELLEPAVDRVETSLGRRELPTEFDGIDPTRFPPCIRALIARVEAGEPLAPHSHYAIAAFLTSIGLGADDLAAVIDGDIPPALKQMAERIAGEDGPTQFPPGSCETMVALGDCIDPDILCAEIEHPLEYYRERLQRPVSP